MFFDPSYLVFAAPALILGMIAQFKVKAAFDRYSQVQTYSGLTGARAARAILDAYGLYDVAVERVDGFLSDHYDPINRVLRLSSAVYDQPSLAAVGVAAHEAGHALQHKTGYAPLQFRSAIVPAVSIGSNLGPLMFMFGLFINPTIAWVGVILYALVAVFTIVTLPVEFDASNRAKQLLVAEGIVSPSEVQGASAVLDAAALTYVAAAIQAISTLLYYVFILTNRRD